MLSCYAVMNVNTLSKYNSQPREKEPEKKLTSIPRLEFVPSTTEIFLLNVLRALSSLYLEKLPAAKTSGNKPMSGKLSYY